MYSVQQLGMEIEETLAKEIVDKSLRKLEDAAIGDANSGKAREIFCTAIATWTREDYEKARAGESVCNSYNQSVWTYTCS